MHFAAPAAPQTAAAADKMVPAAPRKIEALLAKDVRPGADISIVFPRCTLGVDQ
jgi:hypothetical protein